MIRTGLVVVTMLVALAGCATIEGVGQDISSTARTVRNTF